MGGHSKSGTRPIELGLRDDPSAVVRALLDRSFGLIGDCVSACGDAEIVVAEVQECQTTLAVGASPAEVETVCLTCLDTCRDFLATSNAGESERRQYFADLMGLAQTAMADISANPAMAGNDLSGSADRFDAVLKMGTLAEVKASLAAELMEFKRAAAAHQEEFHQTIAGYKDRIVELESGIVRNEREATMDALTGLINRGAFDRTVQGLADMPGAQFVLALLDVDRLKKVNDEHGHLSGDRALLAIAQVLKSTVRDTDLIARYRGDEFAVLMRDCTLRQGESRIHNAVSTITQGRLTADDGRAVQFTISGGLAELTHGDDVHSVAKRAEEALVEAKRGGRNRIVARASAQHFQGYPRPAMPVRMRH